MIQLKRLVMRCAYLGLKIKWWLTRPVSMGVRIMLINDESVVMIRQTYYKDGWYFPGGLVDRGETPLEAAKREAFEEVGATCHSEPRLVGIFTQYVEYKSDHVVLFVCDDFSLSERSASWEVEQIKAFALTALPENTSPGGRRRVAEYLAGDLPVSQMW